VPLSWEDKTCWHLSQNRESNEIRNRSYLISINCFSIF
jgi:hypothetical protein